MTVRRDYVPQNFLASTGPVQGTAQAPVVTSGSGVAGEGNALLQGSISRTSGVAGRVATVKAGEDIRPALESLRSAGGGTLILLAGEHRPTYDLLGGDKINIIGEGIDQTIIDFGNSAYQIKYADPNAFVGYFEISNLTVQNSDASEALLIDKAVYFSCRNLYFYSNNNNGCHIKSSSSFELNNCQAFWNDSSGFVLESDYIHTTPGNFVLTRCEAHSNSDCGFKFYSTGGAVDLENFSLFGCSTTGNINNGYSLSNCRNASFVSVAAHSNDGIDFLIDSSSTRLNFTNCITSVLTTAAFSVAADFVNITSCTFHLSPSDPIISITGDNVSVVNCLFNDTDADNTIAWTAGNKVFLSGNQNGRNLTSEMLDVQYTAVGNVGGGIDSLMDFELKADTVAVDGEVVKIDAWGSFVNNANAKTLYFYIDSTAYLTFALPANTERDWHLEVRIMKTGASSQKIFGKLIYTNGAYIDVTTASYDLSIQRNLSVRGQGVADDDIIQEGMTIKLDNQ